jgi:hypothetical protein
MTAVIPKSQQLQDSTKLSKTRLSNSCIWDTVPNTEGLNLKPYN